MWRGFEEALGAYGLAMVEAWTALGRTDTCAGTIVEDLALAGVRMPRTQAQLRRAEALPSWLGDEAFHLAHRSNLLRKHPAWYGPRFPGVPDDLEYVWPVRSKDVP